jgi:hypothetical protein
MIRLSPHGCRTAQRESTYTPACRIHITRQSLLGRRLCDLIHFDDLSPNRRSGGPPYRLMSTIIGSVSRRFPRLRSRSCTRPLSGKLTLQAESAQSNLWDRKTYFFNPDCPLRSEGVAFIAAGDGRD